MTNRLLLWNVRELTPPPFCTVSCPSNDVPHEALSNAKEILQKTIAYLRDTSYKDAETHLVDQLIHKLKNNLRGQKILLSLKQLQKCLKIFAEMSLHKTLTTCLEDLNSVDLSMSSTVHLPARGVVEFVLVRIIGAAALLGRTVGYAMYSYNYAHQSLKIGMFINLNLVISGLVSRLRSLSLRMMQKLCFCYKSLHELVGHLQDSNVPWLPAEERLPTDLLSWLEEQSFCTTLQADDTHQKQKSAEELSDLLSRYCAESSEDITIQPPDDEELSEESRTDEEEDMDVVDPTQDKTSDDESEPVDHADQQSEVGITNIKLEEDIDLGRPVSRTDKAQEPQMMQMDFGEPVSRSKFMALDKTGKEDVADKMKSISNFDDLAKARSKFRKCKRSCDFLKVVKDFELKKVAKENNVKGFVKLKKAIKALESTSVGKDFDNMLKEVRDMAVCLCNKILTIRKGADVEGGRVAPKKEIKRVGPKQDGESVILKKKAKKEQELSMKILHIEGPDVKEHFTKRLTKLKHLMSVKTELEEGKSTFNFEGVTYELGAKESQLVKKKVDKFVRLIIHNPADKTNILSKAVNKISMFFKNSLYVESSGIHQKQDKSVKCTLKTLHTKSEILEYLPTLKSSLSKAVFKGLVNNVIKIFKRSDIKTSMQIKQVKRLMIEVIHSL